MTTFLPTVEAANKITMYKNPWDDIKYGQKKVVDK